jgi:hypothetical protein
LEAELRTLIAEIEADEKKMAELPESMEKIRKRSHSNHDYRKAAQDKALDFV